MPSCSAWQQLEPAKPAVSVHVCACTCVCVCVCERERERERERVVVESKGKLQHSIAVK